MRDYGAPKPWELPKWVIDRAREEGLAMDPEAAKTLIQTVGSRQQQLQREVEKLRIALHPADARDGADIEALAAGDAAPRSTTWPTPSSPPTCRRRSRSPSSCGRRTSAPGS